jgi:ABC-type multidrug transport system ATPase subunit
MNTGKLVAYGSVEELETQINLSKTIHIKLLGQPKNIRPLLESNPYVSDISITEDQPENTRRIIQIKFSGDDEKIIELLTVLIRLGFHVLSFEVDGNELENIFSHIIKGSQS